MSGHPASLDLAIRAARPGGRVSTLGVYAEPRQTLDMDAVIFKGLDLQGIAGRRPARDVDPDADSASGAA